MTATLDPGRSAQLAAGLRATRRAATLVPADWCPGRPVPERIARVLLHRQRPDLRYDLTTHREVVAAVKHGVVAGSSLPTWLVERDRLLAEETRRVQDVAAYLVQAIGFALTELGQRP